MADRIVGIALERNVRMMLRHPTIEHIMQEEVRQHGADHRPLRRSHLPLYQRAIRHAHRCFQPTLDVEKYPFTVRVPSHRSHQELVIDLLDEALDVEIEHPPVPPTALP